jgi:hypothetical protein
MHEFVAAHESDALAPEVLEPIRRQRGRQFRKGGITTPLTAICALSTKLGFVSDACSSPPSTIAKKAKMPIQVQIMPLLTFVLSLPKNVGLHPLNR